MERQWVLGEDVHEKDNLLDQVTFEDLITGLHCSYPVVTEEAVKKHMNEILDQRLQDMWYLIEKNMDEIIARAMAGRS